MADDETTKEVETIDGGRKPKPRHYTDRMLKPQHGMGEPKKFGGVRDHWTCPRCGMDTFDKQVAKKHRC